MQVKIGPSYFAKEKQDYSDWRFAWVRELCQNSFDAPGCDDIKFAVSRDGTNTVAVCANNGAPMDKDTLINKFLAIGESGKNFAGTVGGFGKAKVLIAFCHESYEIRTGTIKVTGRGGDFELQENLPYVHGTTTTVTMAGDEDYELCREIKRFCSYTQWSGYISLNDEQLGCNLKKGKPRRQFNFGTVYTNKSHENYLIVRMGGIPMFWDWIDFNRCVIVELSGASSDVLTANRDSLVSAHRRELSDFIRELATDKKKALKDKSARYQYFDGCKLRHRVQKAVSARDLVGGTSQGVGGTSQWRAALAVSACVQSSGDGHQVQYNSERVGVLEGMETIQRAEALGLGTAPSPSHKWEPVSQISESFVIRNETDLKIPDYYLPDSPYFGTYGRKLARIWGRLILELHRLFEHEDEFSIGFGFDEDSEASFEEGDYGRVYYLNPAMVVKQENSESRSFRKRFLLTERNRLLAIAAHEFVHGLGFSRHDSDYASKLTDVFAVILNNRERFNWCFR